MKPLSSKGFTLIELLVVISIIGLLSSVVLASLNSARGKGKDAAVKTNLVNARPQAALFFDANNNSYDQGLSGGTSDVCNSAALAGTQKGINPMVLAASQLTTPGGIIIDGGIGSGNESAQCNSNATAWVAIGKMSSLNLFNGTNSGTDYWCVDSSGVSKIIDNPITYVDAATPSSHRCP